MGGAKVGRKQVQQEIYIATGLKTEVIETESKHTEWGSKRNGLLYMGYNIDFNCKSENA